jgi:hypothetical protein
MNLISIYERPDRALVLHQLLEERDESANISHKAMPSWDDHVRFVESKPYQAWYFIVDMARRSARAISPSRMRLGSLYSRNIRARTMGLGRSRL